MKAIKKNKKVLIVVAILSAIVLSLFLVNSSGLASSSLFSSFWPSTPTDPIRNRTATPNRLTVEANGTLYANCCPTSTRMVISKTIDLSPNLPPDDKYEVMVAHTDGTVDRYLIGPLRSLAHATDVLPMPPELMAQLNLRPGDTVLGTGPMLLANNDVVGPTPPPTSTYYTPTIPIFPSSFPNETTTPTGLFPYPHPILPGPMITPTPFYPYP